MKFVENLKKRSRDRKIFVIGCVVAFIGFFIPFISFGRDTTLNMILNRIETTEKVKFTEHVTEVQALPEEEVAAARIAAAKDAISKLPPPAAVEEEEPQPMKIMMAGEAVATLGGDETEAVAKKILSSAENVKDIKDVETAVSANEVVKAAVEAVPTTKEIQIERRAFRNIVEEKVALPKNAFNRVTVEYANELPKEIKDKFDAENKDVKELLTSKIKILNTDPQSGVEPKEPAKPADGASEAELAAYKEKLDDYTAKKATYDESIRHKDEIIAAMEKTYTEISEAEGKAKDAMATDKSLIQYKGASDELGKTKVSIIYKVKNIFAAATFFNAADVERGDAFNATFLVAMWLCTIAGIIVFLLSSSIILDTFVWLIGAGFGIASVVNLPSYIEYLTGNAISVFGYTAIGGYIIFIGWTVALVGVILSAAHVKQQGIRKEI